MKVTKKEIKMPKYTFEVVLDEEESSFVYGLTQLISGHPDETYRYIASRLARAMEQGGVDLNYNKFGLENGIHCLEYTKINKRRK